MAASAQAASAAPEVTPAICEDNVARQQVVNSRLKLQFEQRLKFPSRAIRHDKTSVLLLSWDPGYDDLGVDEEVRKLKRVWEDSYGFKVYERQIDHKTKPQHQALEHLSAFVRAEDAERGLLIIYYAGHGYSDETTKDGDLKWAATLGMPPPPKTSAAYSEAKYKQEKVLKKNSIVWSQVEPAIQNTDADILLIFDCCFAGRLCRPFDRAMPRSYFEFLGACSGNETTKGPGPDSFTTALIWALEQLAGRPEAFSSSELQHKITQYEHFPKGKTPVLAERRLGGEHIVISRKGLQPGRESKAPSRAERHDERMRREFMDIRFHFDDMIESRHVEDTADALMHTMDSWPYKWSRVTFQGKQSLAGEAVWKWRKHTQSRKSASSSVPYGQPESFLEVQTASPAREQPPVVPPIKAQMRYEPDTDATLTASEMSFGAASEHEDELVDEAQPLLRDVRYRNRRPEEDMTMAALLGALWRKLLQGIRMMCRRTLAKFSQTVVVSECDIEAQGSRSISPGRAARSSRASK